MPICLEELGMIPLRNLACFLGELGPICLNQPHIHEELGPFALGKLEVLSPQGSCGNLVKSPFQGG